MVYTVAQQRVTTFDDMARKIRRIAAQIVDAGYIGSNCINKAHGVAAFCISQQKHGGEHGLAVAVVDGFGVEMLHTQAYAIKKMTHHASGLGVAILLHVVAAIVGVAKSVVIVGVEQGILGAIAHIELHSAQGMYV